MALSHDGKCFPDGEEPVERWKRANSVMSGAGPSGNDFPVIAAFPRNAEEQYYMYPKGTFPLDPEQLALEAESRVCPTVILDGNAVIGYGNLYGVEPGSHGWLGHVIIDPDYREGSGPVPDRDVDFHREAGTRTAGAPARLPQHEHPGAPVLLAHGLRAV